MWSNLLCHPAGAKRFCGVSHTPSSPELLSNSRAIPQQVRDDNYRLPEIPLEFSNENSGNDGKFENESLPVIQGMTK